MYVSKRMGKEIKGAMKTMDEEQKKRFFFSLLGYSPDQFVTQKPVKK